MFDTEVQLSARHGMRSALKRAAPNGTSRQKIAPFSLQAVLHRADNAPQQLSTPPPLTTTLSIKISAWNRWMESTATPQQARTTARNWAESKQAQPRSHKTGFLRHATRPRRMFHGAAHAAKCAHCCTYAAAYTTRPPLVNANQLSTCHTWSCNQQQDAHSRTQHF